MFIMKQEKMFLGDLSFRCVALKNAFRNETVNLLKTHSSQDS